MLLRNISSLFVFLFTDGNTASIDKIINSAEKTSAEKRRKSYE